MTSKTYYQPKSTTARLWHLVKASDQPGKVRTLCGHEFWVARIWTSTNPKPQDICRRCEPERKP